MVIDRYIAKTIVTGVILATLVLLGIFSFIDFVTQLKHVGTADYGSMQALLYVALRLPQRFYELAPSILLLGGILSMGAMAANSELIVLRASGVSVMRITRSVLQSGLFVAIFVVVLGEFVVPEATGMAKAIRAEALDKKIILGGHNDIWARDGNRYVNVKRVMPDRRLRDIRVFELGADRHLRGMLHARQARYVDGRWLVEGVSKTTLSVDDSGELASQVERRRQVVMERLIQPELFSVLELEATDMSGRELYKYSRYLEENRLDAGEYRLAFWIKAFMPLTCLTMLVIAMPLVFATTPRSGGVGQRIVIAVVIGVFFYVFSRTMNYLGLAAGLPPVISAGAPLFIAATIGSVLLLRIR